MRQSRQEQASRASLRVAYWLVLLAAAGGRAYAAESSGVGALVDSGVAWIESCPLRDLAFRTRSDGWLADQCGGLFRSSDGGHHWTALERAAPPRSLLADSTQREVRRIEWLDERNGLLLGWEAILRTADGGLTWQRGTPADAEGPWTTARAASTLWLCDRANKLLRSDDAGASWRRLANTPDGRGCADLSFADRDHGWLSSGYEPGRLWQTNDGGATWSALPTPRGMDPPQLLRLSRDVGWLYNFGSVAPTRSPIVYRTNDGGQHWTVAHPSDALAATASRLVVDGQAHDLTAATPIRSLADLERVTPLAPRSRLVAFDEHTTLRIENGAVTWYRDGQRSGPPPLLSPPTAVTEQLAGVFEASPGRPRLGWTALHTYRMDDPRIGWYVIAYHPERFERVILVSDVSAMAQSRSGTLYQSDPWFRAWHKTTDPMLRWQWARLSGHALPSPVACMTAAERGSVSLDVTESGCFHERARSLTVSWTGDRASLTLADDQDRQVRTRSLSSAAARALVARIAEVLERYDPSPSCDSTSNVRADVRWQCRGAKGQRTSVWSPQCGDSDDELDLPQTRASAQMRADLLLQLVSDEQVTTTPAAVPPAR